MLWNHGDFYCLHCFHTFRAESKLELLKKVCGNNYLCNLVIPYEDT